MILTLSGCCDDCAVPTRGMGLSWGDLNPITAARDIANSAISAVGSVAGNIASNVDKVTKETLGTALAVGSTVRTISSPQTQAAVVPMTSYTPLLLGGGAALVLLLLATRKKKAPTP